MPWTSVSRLSVVTESGLPAGEIEVGRWTGVVVSFQPTDEGGIAVAVDPEELVRGTQLIDFADESALGWGGASGWCYKERSRRSMDNGTVQVTFDVTCQSSPPQPSTKAIGIKVRPTDGARAICSSLNGDYKASVEITAT
ncbi:hypothetical protein ABT187_45625 [Streptomyces sp. NPDC001817]|uniref:hypothetical protein n=1 Tax=Streptomyces sp. NPDC001817 TaxID=3154398 RepID=UPI003318AF53